MSHRADLLKIPVLWSAEVFLIEREDGGEREGVGLVELPDLQAPVGAEVDEDVETAVQGVLRTASVGSQ